MPDLAVQFLQFELQGAPQLGVERAEWFVEQQHPRSEHQRPGERDPLLLSTRQLVRLAIGELAEANQFERLTDAAAAFVLGAVLEAEPEADVVGDREVRETAHSSGTPC